MDETTANKVSKETLLMKALKFADSENDIEKCFSSLYDSVTGKLWSMLTRKYIPPLTREDMADVFQDSWIKLLEYRKNFDENRSGFSWMYSIFRNQAIDKIRKFARNYEVKIESEEEEENIIETFKEDAKDISMRIIDNETTEIIENIIRNVGDEVDTTILVMRIIDGKKFEEISKELSIPIATLHYKVNKMLNKIRPKIIKALNS